MVFCQFNWFLRAPKDIVKCFLVVVIFLPSRETPVEIGLYMRKIWDKHDDILLVLTVIALWATDKTPRCLCIKCGRSVIWCICRFVSYFGQHVNINIRVEVIPTYFNINMLNQKQSSLSINISNLC